jgi:hypothetical protein
MQFSLFGCSISLASPGNIGGGGGGSGGGSYPGGFFVPLPAKTKQRTRQVLITIKIRDKSWRRSYVVLTEVANIIIHVKNIVDTTKDKMFVGIDSIRRAAKRVTAVFKHDDK